MTLIRASSAAHAEILPSVESELPSFTRMISVSLGDLGYKLLRPAAQQGHERFLVVHGYDQRKLGGIRTRL